MAILSFDKWKVVYIGTMSLVSTASWIIEMDFSPPLSGKYSGYTSKPVLWTEGISMISSNPDAS
jgi:hypothetical protein